MRFPPFGYMRWTKSLTGTARLDLTASGMPPLELPPVEAPAARRSPSGGDGDPVNEALLGARYGVPAEHVLFVPGTTMANFVLLFVLLERGDEVLVESPAYENLPGLVRLLGGAPIDLPRRADAGFAVDPEEVESAFRQGVRCLVLTDLHNPSGVHIDDAALAAIRESARRHDATIVLDEVYRDFLDAPPGTAYRADDPSLVVTSSLTKVYGMGQLRTGWLFAPPELRERCAELLDYLTVLPPTASAKAAEHVLRNAEAVRRAGRERAARGRAIFESWAAARGDIRFVPPDGGLMVFPAFAGVADTGPLAEWLRTERDTLVVPGRHFGAPDRVRLSFAPEPETLEAGLAALGEGIAKFRRP